MIKKGYGVDWQGSFRGEGISAFRAAVLAAGTIFSTLGCSDGAVESPTEATAVSTEAFTDYNWTYVEQSFTYSFAYDMMCAQHALGKGVTCGVRPNVTNGGGAPMGYMDEPGDLAVTSGFDTGHGSLKNLVKSIALQDVSGTVCVYVLGTDNVTWVTCGNAYSNWPNGTDFAKYTKLVAPITSTGATVCLRKLVEVLGPGVFPVNNLVALGCDGKIYQATHPGSSWVWSPGSTIAPWNMLPSRTWTDISDGDASVGTFLVSSTNEIWIVGIGSQPVGGAVSYVAPIQTGTLFTGGVAYAPKSIGKSVVISSDSRIWTYLPSLNKWSRTGIGIPVAASSLNSVANASIFFGTLAVAAVDDISHLSYHF